MRISSSFATLYLLGMTAVIEASNAATIPPQNPQETSPQSQKLQQHCNELCERIHKQSTTLWTLIAGIRSREDADKNVAIFREISAELAQLDIELSEIELSEEGTGILDPELSLRILQAYSNLDAEFSSLYQANCLDSKAMQIAVTDALRAGFFDASRLPSPESEHIQLNDQEAKVELNRMRNLLEPDSHILRDLSCVNGPETALPAKQRLKPNIQALHKLSPKGNMLKRRFKDTEDEQYRSIYLSIERILWDIRSEYVRIAALPHHETENFRDLSNSLDELYLSLEETHQLWFSIIFDDSFLSDMDNAFEEGHAAAREKAPQ